MTKNEKFIRRIISEEIGGLLYEDSEATSAIVQSAKQKLQSATESYESAEGVEKLKRNIQRLKIQGEVYKAAQKHLDELSRELSKDIKKALEDYKHASENQADDTKSVDIGI